MERYFLFEMKPLKFCLRKQPQYPRSLEVYDDNDNLNLSLNNVSLHKVDSAEKEEFEELETSMSGLSLLRNLSKRQTTLI